MMTPQPERQPRKLRDDEHVIATNMRCEKCGEPLDTNLECNSRLCRECEELEDD